MTSTPCFCFSTVTMSPHLHRPLDLHRPKNRLAHRAEWPCRDCGMWTSCTSATSSPVLAIIMFSGACEQPCHQFLMWTWYVHFCLQTGEAREEIREWQRRGGGIHDHSYRQHGYCRWKKVIDRNSEEAAYKYGHCSYYFSRTNRTRDFALIEVIIRTFD